MDARDETCQAVTSVTSVTSVASVGRGRGEVRQAAPAPTLFDFSGECNGGWDHHNPEYAGSESPRGAIPDY
jgi:hypothetical protein